MSAGAALVVAVAIAIVVVVVVIIIFLLQRWGGHNLADSSKSFYAS